MEGKIKQRRHHMHFGGRRLNFAFALFCLAMSCIKPASADTTLITADELKRISPRARDAFVEELTSMQKEMAEAGIDNPLVMTHFVAQIMTETGGLRRLDEDLMYSYQRGLGVFSRPILPEQKARELAGKPREFANWVYGSRLGNRGRNTDDGWNYRGSGYLQLTGRENFRNRGAEIRVPLENQPDLAREPQHYALKVALAYWKAAGISQAANDDDALRVRRLVNGPAALGLAESKDWFEKAWHRVFKAKASPEEAGEVVVVPDGASADNGVLIEHGYLPEGFEAGSDPATARSDAVKAFQRDVGLPETGVIDEETEYELLDAWRHQSSDDRAPVPESLGNQTASFDLLAASDPNEAGPAPTEANKGSGETVENVNIPLEDQEALGTARGSYADYEMGRAAADPDRFLPYSILSGSDNRKPVTDTTEFPARAIVQILSETPGGRQLLCTGTMVSVDTVLTAAHCVHSGTVSGQPYRNFRIIPGRNAGAAPFGRCKARTAFVLSGWTTSTSPEESRIYDLGALKLDCDVGQRTGWVGMRALTDSEPVKSMVVEGYASDSTPPGRQLLSIGTLMALQTYKGFYDNDTFGGTSGAGVFVEGSPEEIVGVHTNGVYGSDPPWSKYNAFSRLTPERLSRVQEWIGQ